MSENAGKHVQKKITRHVKHWPGATPSDVRAYLDARKLSPIEILANQLYKALKASKNPLLDDDARADGEAATTRLALELLPYYAPRLKQIDASVSIDMAIELAAIYKALDTSKDVTPPSPGPSLAAVPVLGALPPAEPQRHADLARLADPGEADAAGRYPPFDLDGTYSAGDSLPSNFPAPVKLTESHSLTDGQIFSDIFLEKITKKGSDDNY